MVQIKLFSQCNHSVLFISNCMYMYMYTINVCLYTWTHVILLATSNFWSFLSICYRWTYICWHDFNEWTDIFFWRYWDWKRCVQTTKIYVCFSYSPMPFLCAVSPIIGLAMVVIVFGYLLSVFRMKYGGYPYRYARCKFQ